MGRPTAGARNKIQHLVESGRIRSGVTVVVANSIFTDTLRAWMAKPGAQYFLKMPSFAGLLCPADRSGAPLATVIGHIDTMVQARLHGWAWDGVSDESCLVEIFLDKRKIGSCSADGFRADLLAAGVGNGSHGFEFALPAAVFDGRSHVVHAGVRVGGKLVLLKGSALEVLLPPADAIAGDVTLESDGLLHGWVRDARAPAQGCRLRVDIDGHTVAQVSAGGAGPHAAGHGFEVVLPNSWCDGQPHRVRVLEASTGKCLHADDLLWETAHSHGHDVRVQALPAHAAAWRRALWAQVPAQAPTVSVLMPVFNPQAQWLEAAIASVRDQSYAQWQLCVVNDASTDAGVALVLERHARQDDRIVLHHRARNGHICAASNDALAMAGGAWCALLDHDDLLHPDALLHVAAAIGRHPQAGMVFSDEDKCTQAGDHYGPCRKRGWNAELMLAQNAVSHLGVFRTDLVRRVGGFRRGYEGSQDWDLALRVSRQLQAGQIIHIAHVLYHWRAIAGSTALSHREKSYAAVAGRAAVRDHVRATGQPGRVLATCGGGYARFKPALPLVKPRVAVMVRAREVGQELLVLLQAVSAQAWDGVRVIVAMPEVSQLGRRRWWRALERRVPVRGVEVLADASDAQVFAQAAAGEQVEVLLWLSAGTWPAPRQPGWLREWVAQACRPGVGLVAPKLLDATGQRVLSVGLAPDAQGHWQGRGAGMPAAAPRQAGWAVLQHHSQGVDGRAFAVKAALWRARSAVALQEDAAWAIALSERVGQEGWHVLATPYVRLCHALKDGDPPQASGWGRS